jgi:hypothetical protein
MTVIHPPLGAQQITTTEHLDEQVFEGAGIYLGVSGPVPLSELTRVLAQHLNTSYLALVSESVRRLAATGRLAYQATIVSLPAGGDVRDTEGAKMITTTYREPYELAQLPMSCMSNVTAQARWILGLSDTQGAEAIAEVDALVGRALGEHAEPHACLTLLAQEGCRVEELTDFDLDALRAGGADYVRSRRKPGDWSAEDEAYLTPARMAAYLARAERVMQERADGLHGFEQVRLEARRPVFDDFDRLLDDAMLVIAMVEGASSGTSHAVLVYDRYRNRVGDEVYRVYWPRLGSSPTLDALHVADLQQMWLGESLIGVGR